MYCLGCYKKTGKPLCIKCSKTLFEGAKVPFELDFDAPKANNAELQNNTKKMSIPGVQLKYSLHLKGDKLALTPKNGQFILKPIPPIRYLDAIEDVPENEHLTMQIAAQVFKMDTAHNGIIYFRDKEPAYITKRFDVKADGSKYLQEDFAQLLARTEDTDGPDYKFEGSYEAIGRFIKKNVAAYQPELEKLFKIIVFN
ncbi:serine/threonine-protein kinase HipA [Arachidicoccus rhizosphaerae]|uniref:Serine/threonine-protein kinase HipA n=1 Tax=Arachidicoccus rhizosphaerae TaxID=551991 RepID=A0A1H4D210_9BACT|nr:HipA domain-containing protein [Arachidicoccus rhizosphaerae]SEA66362.1 serine/threonine-protein kinase HipA [Arachidicoccus rhizosphaerae]